MTRWGWKLKVTRSQSNLRISEGQFNPPYQKQDAHNDGSDYEILN